MVYRAPKLIDLIGEEIIPSGIFDDWKTVVQVQDYCWEQYGYEYPSATGTLNTAVGKGLLIKDENSIPMRYKKNAKAGEGRK